MEYSQLPSTLPAWADLPSNDRASSQDLDEVSFQVGHSKPAHCRLQAALDLSACLACPGLDAGPGFGTACPWVFILPTSWLGMQSG